MRVHRYKLYTACMNLEIWISENYPKRMDGLFALANAAGVRYQSVQDWLEVGRVPVARIPAISRLTGIDPVVLNPRIAGLAQLLSEA